jgi:hypothetical protein
MRLAFGKHMGLVADNVHNARLVVAWSGWMEKKEEKRRMASEVDSKNVATPFVELLDGFMEQMELAVGSLGRISEGILALVDGVKDLVEVIKRKEASEMDGEQEIVELGVQTLEELEIERVDKEIETEMMGEGDKEDKAEKEDRDQEIERVGKEWIKEMFVS